VTDDFWKMRTRYNFENCWITNVVKCGAGPGRGKPDDREVANCSVFLKRELEAIQPAVIALVGKRDTPDMFRKAMNASQAVFDQQPMVTPITHYSYARRPGGRGRMLEVWTHEFEAIKAELDRRGLTQPVWL
jgi:uracil-DNA glycosylase family 4